MSISEEASPIAFIALKKTTPSFSNFSMDVPPSVKMSPMLVPTVVSAMSPITPINCFTPSKDSPFIPDALSLASASLPMNSEIFSPILTKLSLKPSPMPPMKFPIIVPILPANCSSTGRPESKNFCKLGNLSINAPTATANVPITPIKAARPDIAATPIIANGATNDIFTNTSASIDINAPSNRAFDIALSTQFISANMPTNASSGIVIAIKAINPAAAAGHAAPIIVSTPSIIVSEPVSTTNANALFIALSMLLMRARTPTNATNRTAITVKAMAPFSALPMLILPRFLSATDIANNNADKPIAAAMALRKTPGSRSFRAAATPSNNFDNKLTSASIKVGIWSAKLFMTPMRKSRSAFVIAGACSAKASKTPSISNKQLSANCGAYSPITLAISTIPSPIIRAIVGISSSMSVTMTVRPATIAVAPAAKEAPKAAIPADTKSKPAPIPAIPTPRSANAPANPSIGTIKGFNRRPATPIITKAPASAISPFAVPSKLIEESILATNERAPIAKDIKII